MGNVRGGVRFSIFDFVWLSDIWKTLSLWTRDDDVKSVANGQQWNANVWSSSLLLLLTVVGGFVCARAFVFAAPFFSRETRFCVHAHNVILFVWVFGTSDCWQRDDDDGGGGGAGESHLSTTRGGGPFSLPPPGDIFLLRRNKMVYRTILIRRRGGGDSSEDLLFRRTDFSISSRFYIESIRRILWEKKKTIG